MMDREPEQKQNRSVANAATLENSGYTLSRLGLVPGPQDDDPQPQSAPFKPSPLTPAPKPHPTPPQTAHQPAPAWRDSQTEPKETDTTPDVDQEQVPATSMPSEEEYVRVTVKVPRALRQILRSCAKNTHQYQYVLVIEALAEFLVHLPEEMQRQLLRDVNGESIKKRVQADVPTSTWKRLWKRWLGR